MRIGIIGAGNIAAAHVRAMRELDGVEAAGVYDPDRARAEALVLGTPATAFDSPEELHAAVDGVIIASPNRSHFDHACAALAHGRHVLCEKPMAVTPRQTAEMAERAEASGLVCAVGFNYRYLPVAQELRRRIAAGDFGRILHADLAFKRGSALTRKSYTWRDGGEELATSGALGDLGVHLIDLLEFLFGHPLDPDASLVKLRTNVPAKEGRTVHVDDHAFVGGRLHDGAYVTLTASKSALPDDLGLSLRIIGERQEATYRSATGPVLWLRSGVEWTEVKLLGGNRLPDPAGEVDGWSDTFVHQLEEWADAMAGVRRPRSLAGFPDGHRAQTALDRLLAEGRPPAA